MRKILSAFLILVGALSIGLISGKIVSDRQRAQIIKPDILTASSSGRNFVWGATVRPYILTNDNRPYNPNDLDRQFEIIKDLFPNGCVRANIEGDMAINDQLVKNKEKYGLRLYLILEEIKDFDQNINYEKSASDFAQKIVARYKGKVDYYQLSNELSGVVYAEPSEPGEKLDAGYGLVMNKNRYEHVRRYATTTRRCAAGFPGRSRYHPANAPDNGTDRIFPAIRFAGRGRVAPVPPVSSGALAPPWSMESHKSHCPSEPSRFE